MDALRVRRVTEIVVIIVFLGAISLPLAGKLLPSEGAFALTENRRPSALPTINLGKSGWRWSLVSFPQRFERYWNDSFAFRWYLIRAHSLAKFALGASASAKALVGEEGYLFYAGEESVDYFRAVRPFTDDQLIHWRKDLESRRSWLAERGIRYLVVIAPNKETIYPEFMPRTLRRVRDESRLDQLVRDLRIHTRIEIVDLREPLKRAKLSQRVYHRTDTHWNGAGALIASSEILARIRPWFPDLHTMPVPASLETRNGPGGDLARILALEDHFTEQYVEWQPVTRKRSTTLAATENPPRSVTVMECEECSGPAVLMHQDSFNANLAPILAEHFRRLVLVDGSTLAKGVIERESPALVIQQFVERKLMCADLSSCRPVQ